MAVITGEPIGLERFGLGPVRGASRNLIAAALFEEAIRRREGIAAAAGPLVVRTGKHTGRSPQDKFFVREPGSEQRLSVIARFADGHIEDVTHWARYSSNEEPIARVDDTGRIRMSVSDAEPPLIPRLGSVFAVGMTPNSGMLR